jgi:hypothetical protein
MHDEHLVSSDTGDQEIATFLRVAKEIEVSDMEQVESA